MFKLFFSLVLLLPLIAGCSGVQTFPNMARAGDTVSVAMGWQKRFKRNNTTVTITPSVGEPVVYQPDDPAIRAIINFYPDPLSNIVIGTKTENDTFFKYGNTYGSLINSNYTDGDMDWWQTVAFVDLPSTMSEGEANIQLTNSDGDISNSIVNIIEGGGVAGLFNAEGVGPMTSTQLASLERASNFEVSINASVIPYAVEMEFTHTKKAIVINPNELKNITWNDDGSLLKVMILPASSSPLTSLHDFKFYISGEAAIEFFQDISVQTVKAYDVNGNDIPGVSVSLVADYRL